MGFTAAERDAMRRALELARLSEVLDENPPVGCVLLDGHGRTVGEGCHRGAGTPHAEVMAITAAADRAVGATAVVTLEPCDHTGRTGPCSQALIDAGVRRVVYAQADPNPVAAGGAATLRRGGVEVAGGLCAEEAEALTRVWTTTVTCRRPFVTWKFAATLDGRSAARDGTSRWVSSRAARLDTHLLRGRCDVMLVGTNTVAVDDPALTVRDGDDRPLPSQPLRAVMGLRPLDPARRIFDATAETVRLRTRDPAQALAQLTDLGRRHVFMEGGPTLAAAFLTAGLVDEVVAYVAPLLLGAGRPAVADLGITTISHARRLVLTDTTVVGAGPEANVRLTLRPESSPSTPAIVEEH